MYTFIATRSGTGAPNGSPGYRWYVVGVLCLAYIIAFIDRQAISLLVAPIKREFHVSDFQIGLLQGPAFGIFYTIMGLPLGWLSDRFNRPIIIASAVAAWSIMTALCGTAGSFFYLFSARIGVGVGEAALQPAALSLIGEYFTPVDRPFAVSVFVTSGMIGAGFAFAVGGSVIGYLAVHQDFAMPLIGHLAGWRAVFAIISVPGILVSALALTIHEIRPPQVRSPANGAAVGMWNSLDFRLGWHVAAIAFFSISTYGLLAWLPTYFARVWGWSVEDFGLVYGPLFAAFGVMGGLLGGRCAARLRAAGALDAVPRTVARGLTIAPLVLLFGFAMPNARWAVCMFGIAGFVMSFPISVAPSLIHELCRTEVRGRIIALYYLIVGLVGISCGAPLVGFITDHVFRNEGSIGRSMTIVIVLFGALSSGCSWMCVRCVRTGLADPAL